MRDSDYIRKKAIRPIRGCRVHRIRSGWTRSSSTLAVCLAGAALACMPVSTAWAQDGSAGASERTEAVSQTKSVGQAQSAGQTAAGAKESAVVLEGDSTAAETALVEAVEDTSYIVRRGARMARPGLADGVYLGLRTGAASHVGGVDGFSDLAVGPSFAAELGYQIWRPLAVGFSYHHATGLQPDLAQTDRRTAHLAVRATLPTGNVAPYFQAGVHRLFGERDGESAVGADFGIGLDWTLSERFSIYPELAFHLAPSESVAGSDVSRGGGVGSFGVGMRLNLLRSSRPAEVASIRGPERVVVGETVRFTAENADGGSRAVDYTWRIDGDVLEGNPVDYVFRSKGWFDVEVETGNRAGRQKATATVRVQDELPPPPPPVREAVLRDPTTPVKIVSVYGPNSMNVGDVANFRVRVEAGAAWPINYRWDMGDGTLTEGNNVAHRYESAGTYEISVRARNRKGSDSLTHQVRVRPRPAGARTADAEATGDDLTYVDAANVGGGGGVIAEKAPEPESRRASRTAGETSLHGVLPIDWVRGGYTLMAATSSDHKSAEEAAREYRGQGLRTGIYVDEGLGSRVFRVVVGQFETEQEAVAARRKVLAEGRKGAFLVIELPRRSSR